jgi:hypothetical protein
MAWMQYLPKLNSTHTKQSGRKYYSRNESCKKWPNCSLVILGIPLLHGEPFAQYPVGVRGLNFRGPSPQWMLFPEGDRVPSQAIYLLPL